MYLISDLAVFFLQGGMTIKAFRESVSSSNGGVYVVSSMNKNTPLS